MARSRPQRAKSADGTSARTHFRADNGDAILNAAVPYLGLGGADSFGQDGIWLGKDVDGTYKLYIGNDTQHMYWNGERLVITGVFVGAIAHQIANTRLLCHFDNTTMGSLGQAATSITGSVSYPTGKFGKAINTASGYPSYSPSLFSSAQGTIMAWVKFNTVNNGTNHRLHTVAGAGSTYVMVYEYGGHLIFMAGTNGVDTGYNLVAGTWYHIAFTYDQTTYSTGCTSMGPMCTAAAATVGRIANGFRHWWIFIFRE